MLIDHVRRVRVLLEVADRGSFSAAATALGLTQSAVSQHIAVLEREAGLVLVDRSSRPVLLTEAGEIVVRHGRAVAARLDDADQALGELSGRRATRLRIGSFPTGLSTFVPTALARLRATSPQVRLTVVDDHMQGLLPRLAGGELDLAVVYDSPVLQEPSGGRIGWVPLFVDPYRAVLPEAHHLARGRGPLPLAALADEVWVGGRPDSTWFRILLHACRTAGFAPRPMLTTDDHRAVHAFVAAGLGVGVVPGLAAAAPPPGVVVRELVTGGPVRRIGVAHPAGEPTSAAARAAIEILREVTADRGRRRAVRPRS